MPPKNPEVFEFETGIRHWWSWHPQNGWQHRDHFMVPNIKPNHRVYRVPKLPKNYGKEITPGDVVARSAKSKRVNRKAKAKITPSFHKVY